MRYQCLALALLLAASAAGASERVIAFKTDGREQEQKYLWKDEARTFVLEGYGKPVHNMDGTGRHAIWRFDVSEASSATLKVDLLNSFALSVSTDGSTYNELAREAAQAGSNHGWKTADLTAFLPARTLYVKIEHGAQEEWNGGFGACVFEVRLTLEDTRDIAEASVAQAETDPAIDGVLDDSAWQTAQPLSTLNERFLSRPVARNTTFRLTYDETHWYVAARCAQPGAREVEPMAKEPDDATYSEDAVEFFFSPPGQEEHYHVAVNMGGVVFDELNAAGGESWDADAEVTVVADTAEWRVEAAIPVASMGVEKLTPGQEWRVGLFRVDMENAQYVAWSSLLGGGFHSQERYGKVRLVGTPSTPLPAVNIELGGKPGPGANPVRLALQGISDPDAYKLALDVLPVHSGKLPEKEQDLDQMNPVSTELAVSGDAVETEYTLDRFGAAHLVATLRDTGGEVVSRAVTNVLLSREDVEPLQLTLQQPFVTTEPRIPFDLTLNIREEKLHGGNVRVTVLGEGNTPRSSVEFTPAPESHGDLDIASLPLGTYRVVVEVLDANGAMLASQERPLTKHEPFGEPMRVEIRDGICFVDGEARMPLGFMLAPPTKDLTDAGYDVALFGGETLEGRGEFDTAAENGVWAMPHICRYLRGNFDYDGIRAVVSLRKTEPALFVWYLADEPEAYGDTPEVLRKAYEIIKSIDPYHPVAILTNAPGMLMRYEGCADIILTDPYPIPKYSLSQVADWTDATVAAATAHGQAAWMTPQGFGWSDIGASDAISPTREELTNMLLTCFVHGAKGIIWWPYGAPRNNYWPHFRKMARECRFIEPWMLHGTDVPGMAAGVQCDGDVHWRAWQHEGRILVLATNLARQARTLKVPLPEGEFSVSFPFDPDLEALSGGKLQAGLETRLTPVQTLVAVLSSDASQ